MSATVQTISSLERRLDMAVPVEEIDREVGVRLKKLSRTVKMAGFRPGKVPVKVVTQQYGWQVRSEVIEDAVRRAFGEAVRNQNLRVAGQPKIEPKADAADSKQVEFSATFEVYPEIKVGDLSAVAIERPTVAIGDAEVDRTLDILRKQRGSFEPVDRAAAAGDQVKVDFSGSVNGVAFEGGTARDFPFSLGAGQMLPEFDAAVTGMKSGETKTFPLTFPPQYHSKDLAGKTAMFHVTLKEVQAPKLAEVNADFARSLGIEDGDIVKMRAGVKENVEREVNRRVQAKLKEQVMKVLQEVTPVSVPTSLVDVELQRLMDSARAELESRGMKTGDMPLPPELFREQASRRVTLGLILAEVVKANNLHAKPEQVRAIVDDQAGSYEKPEEIVRWYYSDARRLADIEALVLEDNVVIWAMAQAKVTEKPVAFDELMGMLHDAYNDGNESF